MDKKRGAQLIAEIEPAAASGGGIGMMTQPAYQAITEAIREAYDQFLASDLGPEAAVIYTMSEIGLKLEQQQDDDHPFSAEQFYIDCGLAEELKEDLAR